jgi:hypothetical protein
VLEQGVFIKIAFEHEVTTLESHPKLVDRGQEALSDANAAFWRREFRAQREDVRNIQRPGRPPHFRIRLGVELAFSASSDDPVSQDFRANWV